MSFLYKNIDNVKNKKMSTFKLIFIKKNIVLNI